MFTFKQFHIDDSHCGMKVGTDAVTLGAWIMPTGKVENILDIGSGCGILSLMAAQRFPSARITAVECDSGAADDAVRNVSNSPWAERMEIIRGDIFETVFDKKFDLIISNPPFFTETLRSPDCTRADARHEGSLGVESLIRLSATLLGPSGELGMIAPAGRLDEIIFCLSCSKLEPTRITMLRKRPGRQPVRVLVQAGRHPGQCSRSTLTVDSVDYHVLTKDFYLDDNRH